MKENEIFYKNETTYRSYGKIQFSSCQFSFSLNFHTQQQFQCAIIQRIHF